MNQTPSQKLSPMMGVLPAVDPEDFCLFLCCDSVYLAHHAIPFLYSVDANSPGLRVHIHVVNPEPGVEPLITVTGIDLPHTEVSATYENLNWADTNEVAQKTYYASVRFVRLLQIMELAPATYLALDTDSLVLKDISWLAGVDCDVGVFIDEFMPEHMRVKAGAVLVNPRDASRRFLKFVGENIAAQFVAGNAPWFLDQIILCKVLEEMEDDLAVYLFSSKVFDWTFAADSAIWTGKGPTKYDNETYNEARLKYAGMNEIGGMQERFWDE